MPTRIAALFPAGTVTFEGDPEHVRGELFAAEEACVRDAVEKRRREFTAGRLLARRALAELGFAAAPLLPDADRVPRWPAGVVGSITHTAGYCAVALARAEEVGALGLDAERAVGLGPALIDPVCTKNERTWLCSQPVGDAPLLAKLIFSAKESFYKCRFPRERRFLEHGEVEVEIDLGARRFRARVRGEGERQSLEGEYRIEDGLILTGVAAG